MVIQRWQSVLLLIACTLMACFTFLSLGQVQTETVTYNFTSCGFSPEGIPTGGDMPAGIPTWILFCISLCSAILPFLAIFLFKRFRLQMNCCLFEVVLIIAAACFAGYYGYTEFPGVHCSWSTLALAPLLALAATIMAWNRIRRDRESIRSANRLR